MAETRTPSTSELEVDLASVMPDPSKLDLESLFSGLEKARQAAAAWLGLSIDKVSISLLAYDNDLLQRVAMPQDITISASRTTRRTSIVRGNAGIGNTELGIVEWFELTGVTEGQDR